MIQLSLNGPSWFPLPVNTVRVDGRAFPLAELTGRVDSPSTRLVETGLNGRCLLYVILTEVLIHSRRYATAMSYAAPSRSCSDKIHGKFHSLYVKSGFLS